MADETSKFGFEVEGSYFAEEPVLVKVSTGTIDKKTTTITMVQAVVRVSVNEKKYYEFYAGCEWNSEVTIDISTAFKAELSKKVLTATSNGGDSVTMTVNAGMAYLSDGDEHEAQMTTSNAKTVTVYRGGRTDMEIFMGTTYGHTTPLSTKPSGTDEWEVVSAGDVVKCGSIEYETRGESGEVRDESGETRGESGETRDALEVLGRQVYAEKNPMRRSFRFVNHLGYVESASCMMMESKTYKITSSNINKTYKDNKWTAPRIFSKKGRSHEGWKMSSGFVTRKWAEWFTTEFLTASKHWTNIGGNWVEVQVTPTNESTTVYDESKGEMVSVEFGVVR